MKGRGPIGEFLYEVGENVERFADGQTEGGWNGGFMILRMCR